ncbi:MAG: hypothetical protein L7R83_02530 [Candidatus Poseidonia sp.]|nr:hypothetical protein [Poseidonia sp.]
MNRKTVFWFSNIVGPLILLSYWRGVAAFDDPTVYWGNVSERMQGLIVPWMFVAAAGYLLMFHRFFMAWSEEEVASLHWPWNESDGNGVKRLFVLYAAFLLTSAVWIDLTRIYIEGPSTLVAVAIVAVLWTAGLAAVGFGVLVWPSRERLSGSKTALLGSVMLSIQCTWWDATYWVLNFAW